MQQCHVTQQCAFRGQLEAGKGRRWEVQHGALRAAEESGGMEAGRGGAFEANTFSRLSGRFPIRGLQVSKLCLNPLRPLLLPIVCRTSMNLHSNRQYLNTQHFLKPGDGQ